MKWLVTIFFISIQFLFAYNTEISEVEQSELISKFKVNMVIKQMKNIDNMIYLNLQDTLDNKNYIVVTDTNFNILSEEVYEDEQIWISDDLLTVAGANVINAKDFNYAYSIYDINSKDVLLEGETNDSVLKHNNFTSLTYNLIKLQYIKQLDTLVSDSYLNYSQSGDITTNICDNYYYLNKSRIMLNSLYYYFYFSFYEDGQPKEIRRSEYYSNLLFESGEELSIKNDFPMYQLFNYIKSSNDEKYFTGVYFSNRKIGHLAGNGELYIYKTDDFGLYGKIKLNDNYLNCYFSYDNNFLFLLNDDAIQIYDIKIKKITKTININDDLYPSNFLSIININENTFSCDSTNLYKFDFSNDIYNFKAKFSVDKQKIFLNEEVNFTDLSVGDEYEVEWDFGDGTISTENNPVHSYDEIGAYDVSLNITSKDSQNVLLLEDYIQVFDENKFFIEKSIEDEYIPFETKLKCYTYNDYINYSWSVKGETYRGIEMPTILFDVFGKYDLSVVVYDYFDSDIFVEKNAINAKLPYIGFDDYKEYFPEYGKEFFCIKSIKSIQGGYLLQVNNNENMNRVELLRFNDDFEIVWEKEYINDYKSSYIVKQLADGNYITVSDNSDKFNNYEIDILDDFGEVENQIISSHGDSLQFESSYNIQDILIEDNRTLILNVNYELINNKRNEKLQVLELDDNELLPIKEIIRPYPENDNRYFIEKDNGNYFIINKISKDYSKYSINSIITEYNFNFDEMNTDTLPETEFKKIDFHNGMFLGLAKYSNYDAIIKKDDYTDGAFRLTSRIDDFTKIGNFLFMPHYNDGVFAGLYIYDLKSNYFYDNIFFLNRFAELYDINYEDDYLIFFGKIKSSPKDKLYILKIALDNFINDTLVESQPQMLGLVYPNPASDYVEISIDRNNFHGGDHLNIDIYDVLGNRVLSQSIHPMTSSQRMNVVNLPKGAYIVRLSSENEYKFYKFIKK